MSKAKIPYEDPGACPNCLSQRVSPLPPALSRTARVCVHCDHSWDLDVYDVPPGCVLVRLPDDSIAVMQDTEIPTVGYKTRRQAELFAWATYGMIGAPPASAGRWEGAAKRARNAWLSSQKDVVAGLHAQLALTDLVLSCGLTLHRGQVYVQGECIGSVDPDTQKRIEAVLNDAGK